MTTSAIRPVIQGLSRWVAAELRAEIAKAGLSRVEVGRRIGKDTTWMSRRLSPAASGEVDLTFEEAEQICHAISVDADEVIGKALRARRDSNPQPSGPDPIYRDSSAQTSAIVIAFPQDRVKRTLTADRRVAVGR